MIMIKDIRSYRDGGTIGIWAYINEDEFQKTKLPNTSEDPTITIDFSMPNGTGEWYFGWKNKEGIKIEDDFFKAKVLNAINTKIDKEGKYVDKILTTITTV